MSIHSNRTATKVYPLLIREEAARCILCYDAPCSAACPAGTDPGKFIRSLRFDNPKGAIETIKTNNVLGGVCASVCPSKSYCEGACSRSALDRPIPIRKIQEYLTEIEREMRLHFLKKGNPNGKKVVVIGSGPAGIASAAALNEAGCDVTVYERSEKFGGYLSYGIPTDKLTQEIVDYEIGEIRNAGVSFVNCTEIGRNLTVEELLSNGTDAIVWACGLQNAKELDIPGNRLQHVESGISYLQKAKESPENLYTGNRVIVIGGGDVAMDAARIAKKNGAEIVNIVYRRTEKEMPAYIDEREHTRKAGVNLYVRFKPLEIDGQNSVESVTFESLDNGDTLQMKCDHCILAIGQSCAYQIDILKQEEKGIFVAGDIVSNDKTVVDAVRSGKEAAAKVQQYLMK